MSDSDPFSRSSSFFDHDDDAASRAGDVDDAVIDATKRAFEDALRDPGTEDALGKFEIHDLMSEFNRDELAQSHGGGELDHIETAGDPDPLGGLDTESMSARSHAAGIDAAGGDAQRDDLVERMKELREEARDPDTSPERRAEIDDELRELEHEDPLSNFQIDDLGVDQPPVASNHVDAADATVRAGDLDDIVDQPQAQIVTGGPDPIEPQEHLTPASVPPPPVDDDDGVGDDHHADLADLEHAGTGAALDDPLVEADAPVVEAPPTDLDDDIAELLGEPTPVAEAEVAVDDAVVAEDPVDDLDQLLDGPGLEEPLPPADETTSSFVDDVEHDLEPVEDAGLDVADDFTV
jgi:hypothetical protein